MRSPFVALILISFALAVAGCARNSDLEIELTVPARPAMGPDVYAVAVFMTGDFDFGSVAIDPVYPGVALEDTPQQINYSVLSERADGHVRMVVFFCGDPNCREEDPAIIPQVWLDFERGTYIGHRTQWAGTIDAIPTARPTVARCIDRCEVEGCIEGQGWFCRDDGSHYCQERGADPGAEVCDP